MDEERLLQLRKYFSTFTAGNSTGDDEMVSAAGVELIEEVVRLRADLDTLVPLARRQLLSSIRRGLTVKQIAAARRVIDSYDQEG